LIPTITFEGAVPVIAETVSQFPLSAVVAVSVQPNPNTPCP
jgi:hypothetical protein